MSGRRHVLEMSHFNFEVPSKSSSILKDIKLKYKFGWNYVLPLINDIISDILVFLTNVYINNAWLKIIYIWRVCTLNKKSLKTLSLFFLGSSPDTETFFVDICESDFINDYQEVCVVHTSQEIYYQETEVMEGWNPFPKENAKFKLLLEKSHNEINIEDELGGDSKLINIIYFRD